MKKMLSLLLALLLIMSFVVSANAEITETKSISEDNEEFDVSVLEDSVVFKRDKFTKEWNVQRTFLDENDNHRLFVSVILYEKYVSEGWGPELRIMYLNKKSNEYQTVNTFMALVDDTLYSFEALGIKENSSSVFGGNVLREFLRSLEGAKEVAFRFEMKDKRGDYRQYTIDDITQEELKWIITVAELLESSNAWSANKDPKQSDIDYKATITKD